MLVEAVSFDENVLRRFKEILKMEIRRLVSEDVKMTLLVIVLFVGTVGATSRFDGIGVNLNRALSRALDFDKVNYTKYVPNDTYVMRVIFDPKGMAGLYNITSYFMDLIQPKGVIPEGKSILILL